MNEKWNAVGVVEAGEQAREEFEGKDPYELVVLVLEQQEDTGEYRLNQLTEQELPLVENGSTPKKLIKNNE